MQDRVKGILAAVNCVRNSRVAANKLPAEILERVFLYTQPVYADFVPQWPTLGALDWTRKVTHVCKRRRAIAVSYPALWTTIDLCRHPPTEAGIAILARSGTQLLTALYSTNPFSREGVNSPVLREIFGRHLSRLTGLHITVDRPELNRLLADANPVHR
ncbi:uncharacterized protein SCHCODRAFT_01101940 [Schizophyllum commune H4-8]|nr:uncharacterized protein SCHCODRAFT_01101940 [Schizophyllum commune H4-8]KAI5888227.1 hypothetical protein SCHCODRAFT_01101940 [Schizophyllum commune H4-8]